MAKDELTPLIEVSGVLRPPGSPVPLIFEPLVLLTVLGVLTNILDVTTVSAQRALGTSHSELTGDWIVPQQNYLAGKSPMPPTQVLGQAAYDDGGILGLAYTSTKSAGGGLGVLVFVDRLAKLSSYLQVYNKVTGTLQQRLP